MTARYPRPWTSIVTCVLIGIFNAYQAQAGDLAGSSDPAFEAAVEVWLEDNDPDSLPALARLAADGNIAARLLLSRIAATDQAPSDFVEGLSRKQRVELFRSSSGTGLFRPTWLKTETRAGNPVAAALLESSALAVNLEAIRTLYDIGEPQAAYDLIREVAGNGSERDKTALIEFLPQGSELLPYARALENPAKWTSPGHAALRHVTGTAELTGSESATAAAAKFVEYGYQTGVQNSEFDFDNEYFDELAEWIETAPAVASIANLCRRQCDGGEFPACAVTVFGVVGGYYKAIRFDSPMQTLIEQSRYVASERAAGMVLRRVAFARAAAASAEPLISAEQLQAKSRCLADAVAELRGRRN
jgi:hypothetical protein